MRWRWRWTRAARVLLKDVEIRPKYRCAFRRRARGLLSRCRCWCCFVCICVDIKDPARAKSEEESAGEEQCGTASAGGCRARLHHVAGRVASIFGKTQCESPFPLMCGGARGAGGVTDAADEEAQQWAPAPASESPTLTAHVTKKLTTGTCIMNASK